MMKTLMMAAMTAMVLTPVMLPAPALSQTYDRSDRSYRGDDRRYRARCKTSKGTTGTIAGGAGGALIGSAVGGGTIGTLVGAGGGALLGRHLDRKHDAAQNRKNGC